MLEQNDIDRIVERLNKERSHNISPGVAAIISLIIPGLGHMCKGETRKGLNLMVGTFLGYMFFVIPGIVMHIYTIIDASKEG